MSGRDYVMIQHYDPNLDDNRGGWSSWSYEFYVSRERAQQVCDERNAEIEAAMNQAARKVFDWREVKRTNEIREHNALVSLGLRDTVRNYEMVEFTPLAFGDANSIGYQGTHFWETAGKWEVVEIDFEDWQEEK